MSEELKPCPFCGGEPNLTHDDYVHDDLRPMPVVECKSCSAWVRAEDWNRRAQAQAAPEAEPVAIWDAESDVGRPVGYARIADGTDLYTAPQHDAELVELLRECQRLLSAEPHGILSGMANRATRSAWYEEMTPVRDRIDAKLATLKVKP